MAVPNDARRLELLEERLGVRFSVPARALEALTHKSWVNENRDTGASDNERLEFLGDAVIDLAISHRLMEICPGADEGKLSRLRAGLVNEEGLARVARALELGQVLLLGRGEELTGGHDKSSILADAFEAVIASIFLEGGLPAVLDVVDRLFAGSLVRAREGTLDHDFKSELQEMAQARLQSPPRYRVVGEDGPDHAKTFEVEVTITGEAYGRGSGRNKKDAEQAAAREALERLSLLPAQPRMAEQPSAAQDAEPVTTAKPDPPG